MKTTKILFLLFYITSEYFVSGRIEKGNSKKKPNVIILLSDDVGIGDLEVYNSKSKIKTPHLTRMAKNGFRFLDAHSASSKCSPSRYMLLTGRYSLNSGSSHPPMNYDQPSLGTFFRNAGYHTGIIGKAQPYDAKYEPVGTTKTAKKQLTKAKRQYKEENYGEDGYRVSNSGEQKYSFFPTGDYYMPVGPHQIFDYTFLSRSPCCNPGGGSFENGNNTEPFDHFAIQRPFPEGSPDYYTVKIPNAKGTKLCEKEVRSKGYVGQPVFKERVDGSVYVGNYPPSVLVQKSYDSRNVEKKCNDKALDFIKSAAKKSKPFFLYYGMRAAHSPFNSPLEYRNKSSVGILGDNVMELDDMVGNIFKQLKKSEIEDDTIVIFMSDNGADLTKKAIFHVYGHDQSAFDFKGKNWPLTGFKSYMGEAGHRLPMIWHWPKGINPGMNDQSTVSYIDVFATLADLIGVKLKCNEAPDSRSLKKLFENRGFDDFKDPVIHHGLFGIDGKSKSADSKCLGLRDGKWKFFDTNPPLLFNLENDLSEQFDLYKSHTALANQMKHKLDKMVEAINKRNEKTKNGIIKNC